MSIKIKQIPVNDPDFKQKKVVAIKSENNLKAPYDKYHRAIIFTTFNKNDANDEKNSVNSLMRQMDYESLNKKSTAPPEVTMRKYNFNNAPMYLLENIDRLDYFGEDDTIFIIREFLVNNDNNNWIPVVSKDEYSDNVVHVVIAKNAK